MIKTLAYYPIHYGAEYLDASIKSINDQVDKIVILYTPKPSYGHGTQLVCPETESEIREIAQAASSKVHWVNSSGLGNEGQHRDLAWNFAQGYDVMLAVDADEVWEPSSLEKCIKETYDGTSWRRNVNGFVNFWKSFDWACYDGFQPARLFNLHRTNREEKTIDGTIYHFGYAQSKKIMDYKFEIHGHKDELKPNWLNNTYYTWQPGNKDLHPTCTVWGEATAFDKQTLPEVLKNHPNFNKQIIS
jgi:glycosyltransferase involved in cell wall biosynthesis